MYDDEEFCLEDHVDDFQDYYCNDFRCLKGTRTNAVEEDIKEYVQNMYKELYLFPRHYFTKTPEDICSDLQSLLGIAF